MKKAFILIISIIFSSLLILNPAGAKSPEYVAGEIILKLSNNVEEINFSSEGVVKTGIKSVDSLNAKYKVKSMEKLEKSKEKSYVFKKHGLDRLYLLKVSKKIDISEAIKEFNQNPNIEYAELNYLVKIDLAPNDPSYSALWGLHNTGQTGGTVDADMDVPEAWDLQTGSNDILIAVIDTGVDYNHEDLAVNMWVNPGEIPGNNIDDDGNGFTDDVRGWNFSSGNNDPFDDHGHGTHCAGTIGAVGDNNIGVVGVNWNVKILPIKFLNASGGGTTVDAINSVNYATLIGVDVMSNSWGGGPFSQSLKDAITAANEAGILFVAAAGNSNSNNDMSPHYPSNYDVPNVVSVAATDHNDNKASFSSYGLETVDIGAPGVNIYSTVPTGTCLLCATSGYSYLSGTSMATPHVAGVAGLIKAQFSELASDGVRARLMGSADKISSLEGITVSGGRVNAYSSLETDTIPPDAIVDLAAGSPTFSSIALTWTATGDDNNTGTAAYYDIRYSSSLITEENWGAAIQAVGELVPQISGSTETFTVTGLSHSTTYYFALKAFDNVNNPSGLSNNTSEATAAMEVFFADDMESGTNGWTAEGINDLWELGVPTSGPGVAYSGTNLWAINLSGNYGVNYTLEDLTSQTIDLTYADSAMLVFQNWYYMEAGYDGGVILISTDDGVTWQYIDYDGYDYTLGCNNPIPDDWFAFSGSSNGWRAEIVDLASYIGDTIKLKFEFASDCSINSYPGWYIDDVAVLGTSGNQAPTADAGSDQTADDVDGTGVENITLDGSASTDPDGTIVSYEWKEGETVLSTTTVFSYDFTVGTHTVILTVSDDGGLSASDEVMITINPNQAPTADAGSDQIAMTGETVFFDGSASTDPDGTIVSYEWNFDDGSSSDNGVNVTHVYTAAGTYMVSLTVVDNGGAIDLDTMIVTVQEEINVVATITGHSVRTKWDKRIGLGKVETSISFVINDGLSNQIIVKEITDGVGNWNLEKPEVTVKINGVRYIWNLVWDNGNAVLDFGAQEITLSAGDQVQISKMKLLNDYKGDHCLTCQILASGTELATDTLPFSF